MNHSIPGFPTHYTEILERIETINPVAYNNTRNYTNGAVSYLSPYLSRGIISLPQVKASVLKRYTVKQSYKFLAELAWREYFQRVWQHLGTGILKDIKRAQENVQHHLLPKALTDAATGIDALNTHTQLLYETGYMHNHIRMYTAMLTCNVGAAHWLLPAQWMYYYLLDGDPASNMLSWQWVAGSFSSKKYFANQENINRYTGSGQSNTYLDQDYTSLANMPVPEILRETVTPVLNTPLPVTKPPVINPELPLLLYNSFQLDTNWHKEEACNRVLVLEPSHFNLFPVSEPVMRFVLQLAANIEGLQVFTGSVNDVPELQNCSLVFHKEHPTTTHYPGIKEPREWLFPGLNQYYPSFSAFWKKAERLLW
jgi:deoxyribodipyrimidine photo-lyase